MRLLLRDLAPNTAYRVQVRSAANGQFSEWTPAIDLQTISDNYPTLPVTNLTGVVVGGVYVFTWTKPLYDADGKGNTPIRDFKDYLLTFSDGTTSRSTFSSVERFDFTPNMSMGMFGRYANTVTLEVRTRDTNDNVSTPVSVTVNKFVSQPVTNLQWNAVGTSFVGSWTAPTTHTDGSVLDDFLDYQVEVVSGTNTKFYYVTEPSFTFSLEENMGAFGSPQGTLTINVRVRDFFNGLSSLVTATRQNPVPVAVTGLRVAGAYDVILIDWERAVEDDIKYYEVYYSTNATDTGTMVYRGIGNSFNYPSISFANDHYFYVRAVDIFNQSGPRGTTAGPVRPKSSSGVDSAVPSAPTALVVGNYTVLNNQIQTTLSWTPPGNVGDISEYRIRYSPINTDNLSERTWQNTFVPVGQTSVTIRNLLPNKNYIFEVYAVDYSFNASSSINTTTTTATPDAKVSTPLIVSSGVIRSNDYSGSAGWQLSPSTLDIQQGTINARALLIQNGRNLAPAPWAGFEFRSDYYADALVQASQVSIVSDSKFETQALNWQGTVNTEKYVYLSKDNLPYLAVTQGTVYILSIWAKNNQASSRTFNMNVRTDAGTTATVFTATLSASLGYTRYSGVYVPPSNVSSIVPFISNSTSSVNFNFDGFQIEAKTGGLDTPSPWAPPGITQVDGAVIRTGEIRSNVATVYGDTTQPAWSLNTAGNMQINDGLIRGRLVVGSASSGTSNDAIAIRSYNYVAGSTGWQILANGNTEFNDSTFRGRISALTGNIGGVDIANNGLVAGLPGFQRVQLNDEGISSWDDEGSQNLALSPGGTNFITFFNDAREPVASVLSDGSISGQNLNIQNELVYRGEELSNILDPLPKGLVARGVRSTDTTWVTTSADYLEIAVPVVAGRSYRISTTDVLVDVSEANTRADLEIRYTLDGTMPTYSSNLMRNHRRWFPTSNAQSMSLSFLHQPTTTRTDRYLLIVRKGASSPATSQVRILGSATSAPGGQVQLLVEDLGVALPDIGVERTGVNDPAPPASPPEAKKNYTSTWDATWSGTYAGGGALIDYYGNEARQGNYSQSFRGMIGFTGGADAGEDGKSITSALNGATVTKVEVYLYFFHWYSYAGGQAVIGVHGQTSKPTNQSGTEDIMRVNNWARNSGKWVTLPSSYWNGFKTGSYAGITLGSSTTNDLSHYGKAYGVRSSNGARLRITYTR